MAIRDVEAETGEGEDGNRDWRLRQVVRSGGYFFFFPFFLLSSFSFLFFFLRRKGGGRWGRREKG